MMHRFTILSFFTGLAIGVTSCVSQKGLPGRYIVRNKGYQMEVVIKPDSTFHIEDHPFFEVHKNGKGNWRVKHPDTLVLTCKDYSNQELFAGITQDYLQGDVLKFRILKNGKLQFHKVILKRVKSQNGL
jgi:hypothetical protein